MIKNKLIKNAKKVDKFLINYLKKTQIFINQSNEIWSYIWGKKIRSTVIFDAGKIFNLKKKN